MAVRHLRFRKFRPSSLPGEDSSSSPSRRSFDEPAPPGSDSNFLDEDSPVTLTVRPSDRERVLTASPSPQQGRSEPPFPNSRSNSDRTRGNAGIRSENSLKKENSKTSFNEVVSMVMRHKRVNDDLSGGGPASTNCIPKAVLFPEAYVPAGAVPGEEKLVDPRRISMSDSSILFSKFTEVYRPFSPVLVAPLKVMAPSLLASPNECFNFVSIPAPSSLAGMIVDPVGTKVLAEASFSHVTDKAEFHRVIVENHHIRSKNLQELEEARLKERERSGMSDLEREQQFIENMLKASERTAEPGSEIPSSPAGSSAVSPPVSPIISPGVSSPRLQSIVQPPMPSVHQSSPSSLPVPSNDGSVSKQDASKRGPTDEVAFPVTQEDLRRELSKLEDKFKDLLLEESDVSKQVEITQEKLQAFEVREQQLVAEVSQHESEIANMQNNLVQKQEELDNARHLLEQSVDREIKLKSEFSAMNSLFEKKLKSAEIAQKRLKKRHEEEIAEWKEAVRIEVENRVRAELAAESLEKAAAATLLARQVSKDQACETESPQEVRHEESLTSEQHIPTDDSHEVLPLPLSVPALDMPSTAHVDAHALTHEFGVQVDPPEDFGVQVEFGVDVGVETDVETRRASVTTVVKSLEHRNLFSNPMQPRASTDSVVLRLTEALHETLQTQLTGMPDAQNDSGESALDTAGVHDSSVKSANGDGDPFFTVPTSPGAADPNESSSSAPFDGQMFYIHQFLEKEQRRLAPPRSKHCTDRPSISILSSLRKTESPHNAKTTVPPSKEKRKAVPEHQNTILKQLPPRHKTAQKPS
eukprot:ANDGO_03793.mRNA.1 hypothetical protein